MKIYPVDPNGYEGSWKIGDAIGQGKGQVALADGMHTLELCGTGASFEFTIKSGTPAASSTINCASTSVTLKSGNTITLENTQITVDPQGYDGLRGYFGFLKDPLLKKDPTSGFWTVWLPKGGTYEFVVASGASFPFTVSDAGHVSVDSKQTAAATATGADTTLTLQTTKITIESDGYQWTHGAFGLFYGAQVPNNCDSLTVVKGLHYKFTVAYGATFPFSVTDDGTLMVDPTETLAANAQNGVLTLNLRTIIIDDGGYERQPGVLGIHYGPKLKMGERHLEVVQDVRYQLAVAYAAIFPFFVDKNGQVDTSMTAAATSSGATLELALSDIEIDAGGYDWKPRAFGIFQGPNLQSGSTTLRVPRGVSYQFAVAGGVGFPFRVDNEGNVDATATKAADSSGAKLSLQTTDLGFGPPDPNDSAFNVRIVSGPTLVGTGTLRLVRSVKFTANINGAVTYLTVD